MSFEEYLKLRQTGTQEEIEAASRIVDLGSAGYIEDDEQAAVYLEISMQAMIAEGEDCMNHDQTKPPHSSQHILVERSYEQELAERIAVQHAVEANQRGIPLWMLTGFAALSTDPDEDDDILE